MNIKKTRGRQTKSLFPEKIYKIPEKYFSGDKPNKYINEFVTKYGKQTNVTEMVSRETMGKILTSRGGSLGSAIFDQHGYWSKKAYGGIEQYIKAFSRPGEIVLDPFCGSGGTLIVAITLDRHAIGIDLSPASTFISAGFLNSIDPSKLLQAGRRICIQAKESIKDAYILQDIGVEVDALIVSDTCRCLRCLEIVSIGNLIERDGQTYCSNCKIEPISTRSRKVEYVGEVVIDVVGNYTPTKIPTARYRHEDAEKIRNRYLLQPIPKEIQKIGRLNTLGIKYAGQLFSDRAVICLFEIKRRIEQEPKELQLPLLFVFSSILLNTSRMYRVRKGGGGGPAGNYYVPAIRRDNNVFNLFEAKLKEIANAKELWNSYSIEGQAIISTQSAGNLELIPSNSIDYIFTDPPYSDKMPYGALNTVWEAWLGFDRGWLSEEVIGEKWESGMRKAVNEMERVLKQGRWLSLCYHDTSEGTWELVQDIFAEAGFLPDKSDSSLHIDTKQRSMQQQKSDKVIKRDLVINFQKPILGKIQSAIPITGKEDTTSFKDKVHNIIRNYLESCPGSTKDRIYDEVVSRMVRLGQMEAHDFGEILRQVADEVKQPVMKDLFTTKDPDLFGTHEISRWYLKETELDVVDKAETAKEDAAANFIASYIEKNLKDNPHIDGVHYSDLFEHYIYSVKNKPRRLLGEWIYDYFYKTESGTYRLPASEEEELLKAEGRAKGIMRRIKQYVSCIEQGTSIPDNLKANDTTLVEWIRHCKRSGLFEQGKLLYEKGGLNIDDLAEENIVEVEEDYQVCIRMIERGKK